ncbi:MAG: flagellar hook-length control protein FliK [Candidatus Eremiobacteraeota bacterium]|nr:flagellar hook-length control protein FliK [Candidatus Eremiobacteraeota bacterium]
MGAQLLKILPGLFPKAVVQGAENTTRGLVEHGRRFDEILQRALIEKAGSKIDLKSIPPALLALLQSGMPLNTVVNQIAQTLTGKVASALGHGAQHAISEIAKNKLLQAFASALAPPGGSPPGSTAEQASALADQLQQLVANIARVAEAGQQNRFTGNILDAITAKENPAQQQSEQPASKDAVVASFVESVLRDAVSRIQASAIDKSATPAGPSVGLVAPSNADNAALLATNDPSGKTARPSTGPVVRNSPEDTVIPAALLKAANPEVSVKPAADQPGSVLGRMLARAANVDARINGNPNATASAIAIDSRIKPVAVQALPAATPQVDPRASLENLVAAIVDASKNANGNNGQNASSFGWNQAQNALAQISDGKAKSSTLDGPSFASQANALLGGAFHTAATAAGESTVSTGLTPYTTVDPNSLIDQVVKGVIVRNFGENNSEIRMRLSPEHLGDVSLKLSVTGGNISASITAQNADVRDTLLANQNQLSKSLADAGLKLANFSVNVSGGGANAFAQQQQFAQQAGVRRVAFHIGNDESQDEVMPATPSFGPPIMAHSNLGLLNYLA